MTTAEDELWELRQGGWGLERYVEEFLELSNRVSWHDASLGTCFHLGLNDKTIRCELPTGSYPLIELINLVLFLNGSDREVETVPKSCHPAPAGTSSASPAHPMPRTSAYLSNCSPHLPDSEDSPSSPLVPSSSSSSPLVPSSSSSSPLVLSSSSSSPLVLPSSSSLVPPSSSPLVPSSSALTERPQVPLGLLVDYEGMVWSRAPEPAPRQRPPVPAPRQRPRCLLLASALRCLLLASALRCLLLASALRCLLLASALPVPAPRQRPPVPAPRLRPPVPAPRLRPPVPAPRLRPPVPAPRQHPPVVAPRKLSPSFPLVLSSSALSERPRDAALPERPPVPVPSGSPEPLPVPSGSPEPLPVPSGSPEPLPVPSGSPEPLLVPSRSPEPLLVPSGSPEPLPFPSGSPEPLATTPPKSLHVMKSLPKKILGGGYPPWRPPKLPAPPWPPESPDPPGPPKLPDPPWSPELPDPPWPPELPDPPWPPELPDPPWPPELPAPPWPPELPAPPWLLEWAPPWRPPVLSCVRVPWGLQSAHPPSPLDVIRRGTRLLRGGGNVRLCLPLPCVSLPVLCAHIWSFLFHVIISLLVPVCVLIVNLIPGVSP